MTEISVLGLGSYLPGDPLTAAEVAPADDPMARSPLFRPPATRHHVARGQTAGEMVERAARPMFEQLGLAPRDHVDLLVTNTLLPDNPITGCGAEAAARLGCTPEWIIDLHNGGCAALPYMLKLATAIMHGGEARTALLCTVQNTAGQVFCQPQTRGTPQAAVPGDGCGVLYVGDGPGSPVLATTAYNDPSSARDMHVDLASRRYWETGAGEFNVAFDPDAFEAILRRGNSLVPAMVRQVCNRLEVEPSRIDVLVTNQPNRQFLRNWRDDLGIDASRHLDTFDRYGNLYGAGVAVTLHHASREGKLHDGNLIVLAGFAHAGDFAAAAALRWRAPH